MPTLVLLIGASVLGMWLGAGVVSRWPRRNIQIGMGIALLVAAALTLMAIFNTTDRRWDVGRPPRRATLDRRGGELCPGRLDVARHRPLRPLPHHDQPPRHGPARRLSDHDGLLRLPDAGRQHPVHPEGELRPPGRARAGARRHSRRAHRGVHRQVARLVLCPVAGGGGRGVYRDPAAAHRRAGTPRLSSPSSRSWSPWRPIGRPELVSRIEEDA